MPHFEVCVYLANLRVGLKFQAPKLRCRMSEKLFSTDNIFLGIYGLLSQIIDGQKETEAGYRLLDAFWGEGDGTEAAGGCIQYGKKVLKLTSIISLIRPVNLPSIRVSEKNGLKFEKETVFQNTRHLVYRINLNET